MRNIFFVLSIASLAFLPDMAKAQMQPMPEEFELIYADVFRDDRRDKLFLEQQLAAEIAKKDLANKRLLRIENLFKSQAMSEQEYQRAKRDALAAERMVIWAENKVAAKQAAIEINSMKLRWFRGHEEPDIEKLRAVYKKSWKADCDGDEALRDASKIRMDFAEYEIKLAKGLQKGHTVTQDLIDEKTNEYISKKAHYQAFSEIVKNCRSEKLLKSDLGL